MMTRFVISVIVIALCRALLPGASQAKPLEDYDWIEVSTDRFRIRTIRGERAALKYARELALLLKVVPRQLRYLRHEANDPVTFYVLRYANQVEELLHDERPWFAVDLWYQGLPAERSVVMGTFSGTRNSIDYVLARYWFGGGLIGDPLHWWQEGLVEYFRYTGINRGFYYFGAGVQNRLESPAVVRDAMELILAPTTRMQLTPIDRRVYQYYAHRLIRFLMENRKSWDDFALRLRLYIDLVDDGADYRTAFGKAFEMTMDELAEGVSEHGRTCCTRYKVPLEILEADFDPQLNDLERDTIKAALDAMSASALETLPESAR
jgi:hypothetical protein